MKRTASLVRYQNVWREIVGQKEFRIQDAVYRYGYSDQSHLLNEFRRFHGVWPDQAKASPLWSGSERCFSCCSCTEDQGVSDAVIPDVVFFQYRCILL